MSVSTTPISAPSAHPARFQVRQPLAICVLSAVAGAGLGALICLGLGWAEGKALTSAAVLAGVVWVFASILGAQVLALGTAQQVDRLGMGILASSSSRMMSALLIGIITYFIARPEGRTFWIAFLGAGMLALIGEAFWAVRTINSAPSGTTARPGSGAADGAA